MTMASEIATLGLYDSTDITNQITESFDIISLFIGSTVAENDSADTDRIAKIYAIYLLDRLQLQKRSVGNETVVVPPLMSEDIRQLINELQKEPETKTDLILLSTNTPGEDWFNPTDPRI